jgi:hypothetical protein
MEIVLIVLSAVGTVGAFLFRRNGAAAGTMAGATGAASKPSPGGRLGGLITQVLPDAHDEVISLQRNVIAEVFRGGFRMLGVRSLVFGNTITVAISAEAQRRIKPVQARVVEGIVAAIVERADREGYELSGVPNLRFVVDNALVGMTVRVEQAIDDDTPAQSLSSQPAAGVRKGVHQQVALQRLDTGERGALPTNGSELVIGRSASTDWHLDSPLVSAVHCKARVSHEGGDTAVELVDLDSTNGTYVDGKRIATNKKYRVQHGSLLSLGPEVKVRVLIGSSVDEDTAQSSVRDDIP